MVRNCSACLNANHCDHRMSVESLRPWLEIYFIIQSAPDLLHNSKDGFLTYKVQEILDLVRTTYFSNLSVIKFIIGNTYVTTQIALSCQKNLQLRLSFIEEVEEQLNDWRW